MKILSYFALVCALAGTGYAEMPSCYKSVNRVTWLVQNVDLAKQGWIQLGLSDIHEYPDVVLTGQDHGKPVKMWAWEITGHLGNLTVDMIQPAEGQLNAWNDFLGKHGDGIFSIVHEVKSQAEMTRKINRMHALGVGVLQQLSFDRDGKRVTYTYFDTETQGKFVLGLVYWPGGAPAPGPPGKVSHSRLWSAIWSQSRPTGRSWAFPHSAWSTPLRGRIRPIAASRLWFAFDVGYQNYDQFSYEWICRPGDAPEYLRRFPQSAQRGHSASGHAGRRPEQGSGRL